jgi:predicted HAD superfamily phosphohydrolase YqeG
MQSNPLKSSVYRNMTLHIFHTINIIKHFKEIPAVMDEQIIPFTFKKSGMKKLIIFDLDETLIHCHVEQTYDENED